MSRAFGDFACAERGVTVVPEYSKYQMQPGDEKARIEATGNPPGEVREVGEGNFRIYIKGENYPGLTMSRAFGDFACCERGVIQKPEYSKYQMQPGDEWYAIVASDGIWEFLEGEAVEKLTSKKLRLKGPRETLRFLFDASRKR